MTAKQDSKLQSCVLLFCSAASSAHFRLIASYVPPHPTRSDFFYPFVSVLLVCHTFAVRGKQGEQKTGHQKKIQPPRHRETGFQRCDIAARCTQMFVHAAAESSVLEKALQRRVLLCLFVFTSREREMGGGGFSSGSRNIISLLSYVGKCMQSYSCSAAPDPHRCNSSEYKCQIYML